MRVGSRIAVGSCYTVARFICVRCDLTACLCDICRDSVIAYRHGGLSFFTGGRRTPKKALPKSCTGIIIKVGQAYCSNLILSILYRLCNSVIVWGGELNLHLGFFTHTGRVVIIHLGFRLYHLLVLLSTGRCDVVESAAELITNLRAEETADSGTHRAHQDSTDTSTDNAADTSTDRLIHREVRISLCIHLVLLRFRDLLLSSGNLLLRCTRLLELFKVIRRRFKPVGRFCQLLLILLMRRVDIQAAENRRDSSTRSSLFGNTAPSSGWYRRGRSLV